MCKRINQRNYKWLCHANAITHKMNGKRVTLDFYYEGAGDIYSPILNHLNKRKDKGFPFVGEEIEIVTVLGQHCKCIYEDNWGIRCLITDVEKER